MAKGRRNLSAAAALNVFVNWAWNYLTDDHGSRLLLDAPREPARG